MFRARELAGAIVRILEILGDMLGKQNVPGIPAFHHPLRYVETSSCEIGATGHIDHTTNRAAVHSHAELRATMFLSRSADLYCALHRRFYTGVKDQRHSIPSWDISFNSSTAARCSLIESFE
jgi:hypothetical protein